jgi:hypothetical protein
VPGIATCPRVPSRCLARALPAKQFVGIDPDEALVELGRLRGVPDNVTLLVGSADELDRDARWDVLVLRLVTPYLPDPGRIAEWARVRARTVVVIDPVEHAFSIQPSIPHPAFDVGHAESERSAPTAMLSQRAGYDLDAERELVVRLGPQTPRVLLHQLMVLRAQLALGAPPPRAGLENPSSIRGADPKVIDEVARAQVWEARPAKQGAVGRGTSSRARTAPKACAS